MSKKSKTLLITLAVLVLLGGGYYASTIWGKKKNASEQPAYTPPPELGHLESSGLVKIENPGVTIEKINGFWELTYLESGIPPGGIELDQSSVQYMTYSLATIWAERVIEEEPEDLSVYGLDNSTTRTIVTDSDGKKAMYILGDMTPARTAYYFMEEGDPKVYSVAAYVANYMLSFLDGIRKRALFPAFEIPAMTRLWIDLGETQIDIIPRDDSPQSALVAPFSTYIVSSPYKYPRGADTQALDTLLTPFKGLEIADFIDDAPVSLLPYGLDKPVRFILQTQLGSLELLIGNEFNGKHYVKLANAPGVFTLRGMESVTDVKPFTLIDKFALIINIDQVDHFTVSGGEKVLSANLQGSDDDVVFFLNGKKTEISAFRGFYQTVIGLLMDAEIPESSGQVLNQGTAQGGNITIEYRLNTPPGARPSITLIPFDRDFYALRQDGTIEFLISRNQIRKIFETADSMKYEE